jgi:hypothetical protein
MSLIDTSPGMTVIPPPCPALRRLIDLCASHTSCLVLGCDHVGALELAARGVAVTALDRNLAKVAWLRQRALEHRLSVDARWCDHRFDSWTLPAVAAVLDYCVCDENVGAHLVEAYWRPLLALMPALIAVATRRSTTCLPPRLSGSRVLLPDIDVFLFTT